MTDSHECGSVSTELASAPTQFAPSPPPALDGVADAGPERAGFAVNRPYAMPSDLLAEKFGPLFYADFGGAKRLYACSLELVDELCDESRFAKNPMEPLARARPLVGDGLFTAFRGEPNWQKAHDVLLPGFSYSGLRNYHTAMLEINDRLVAHWDDAVGARPVDVGVDLQKLAMDTVGLAGFGARFDSFTVIEGFAEIPTSFLTASSHLPPDGDEVIFNAERARLYGFIDELIADHQRGRTGDVDDLLNLMLAAGPDGKPALGGQAIRNQVLTFLIAGQLTTSELMPMAVYNLLHHPAVLHRAQADVDTVFGPEDNYAPTYEDIGKLTFLRQVIDETLRLSPPASSFDRMALADTVIGGRYPIKQGEAVSVLVGALHRQPQWGDNVELFDPDRFTPEHTASRPASLFKPFGTGARSCIGRQFALHEATLTLSRLLHRYRMLDSGHYTLRYESTSRRRPVGFLLDLRRRTPADRSRPNTTPSDTTPTGAATPAATPEHPCAVVAAGTTVAVLHGSNLGTCRALAKHVADDATAAGCLTTVGALDTASGGLPEADVVLIVASSYNGQPTDDARDFLAWLNNPDTTLPHPPLYAVLGVGDHNWTDTYQAVPRHIDERLAALGAQPLLPRAEADTSGDLTGVVEQFSTALSAALNQRFGDPDAAPPDQNTAQPLYTVRRVQGPLTAAIDARFEVVAMTVLENNELVSVDNLLGQAKRHLRIALPEGISYQTGDHLTILADNPPELVAAVLERFEIDPDLRLSINPRRSSGRLIALDREVSARELLTHFVELRKPTTASQLRTLAEANPCPPERRRIEELAANSESALLSPLECLLEFPGCQLTAEQVLELLDPMTPRHYSIASSSRLFPDSAAIVVSVLDAPARSGHGLYRGVASNHLAAIRPGQQIRARIDPARQAFRAGANPAKNVILVSAGTGVAPFCGFLGDRYAAKHAGEPYAPALCFFGVRHPDVDYIFRDQFEAAEADRIVRMRPVFSRAPKDGVIRYVQDLITASADEVWQLLGDPANDTHVYVCGDGAHMAPAVRNAFLDIYRARTGAGENQAQGWLADLVTSDHYVEDVWAQ